MLYYSHMVGFRERLSAIKGKQEAADQMKKEQVEKATEEARLERQAKRSALSSEYYTVRAEFAQAEQTANEAREAILQADAFAAEQGENLDPEARAEIDTMKVEAREAQQRFEELKTKLDALRAEISAFEESVESQTQDESVSTDSSESPEDEDAEAKTRLQEEANIRAFDLWESILKKAKLWDKYASPSEIQAALQPTIDALKQSGNLVDYLALKSVDGFSTRIDISSAAMQEDPTTLEKARTEILTAEQNREIDNRLQELGEETAFALSYQANKAGVSVEEFLASNPGFLAQVDKNALDFRSRTMAELSPEDRGKVEEQANAKLNAIKTYNRLREENLKRSEGIKGPAKDSGKYLDAASEEYRTGMEADIEAELQVLKSEGKIAEYLALKGTVGPNFTTNPRNLDFFRVKDLVEIVAKEDQSTIDNLRAVLTTEQNLALDQKLSQAK